MTDIFNEVDEEVRREQLKKLWERTGFTSSPLCVLIVVGVGAWRGYEWWQGKQAAQSGAAFEQAVDAGGGRQASGSRSGLRQARRRRHGRLSRAGAVAQAAELAPTDRTAAVKAYDEIAADKNAGQIIQDLAAVRAGYLLVDTAPYSELLRPA